MTSFNRYWRVILLSAVALAGCRKSEPPYSVADAPNVWYLEDTNGDGVSDVRKLVLTGFAVTNPQHTVNNPVYGLDNWIYIAHEGPATAIIYKKQFGDRGSDIRFPVRPDLPGLTE